MAFLHLDHYSDTVKLNLPLGIILPEPPVLHEHPLESCKVLFLLHGLTDDCSAWQRYTAVEIFARDLELVVVMPSAGRSFYTDQDNGQSYFKYINEELPEYLGNAFRLNLARDNTLIAGNSMGGYGAFKSAFLHPELYSAAFSLSGLLSVDMNLIPRDKVNDPQLLHEMGLLFGGLDKVPGSENDTLLWLRDAAANPANYPDLYAVCGLEDDLLELNRFFMQGAAALNIPIDYYEEKGGHTWNFWNRHLERWLHRVCAE